MAGNLNELIFIKRVKKHPHEASHGGAWKIAYADFVTAMMAFFLLMWLLNSTSQEQRNAISNYFAPQSASKTTSGAGGVLGGRVLDVEGALTASRASPRIVLGVPQIQPGTEIEIENPREGDEANSGPLPENEFEEANQAAMGTVPKHDLASRNQAALGTVAENDSIDAREVALARAEQTAGTEPLEGEGGSLGEHRRDTEGLMPDGGRPEAGRSAEDAKLAEIERELEERIGVDPVLRPYKSNIQVERTAEGLRIQMIDDDEREMFPLGSAELLDHTKALLDTVADLVKDQPNRIAISGHTDSIPYRGSGGYSNWELSTDRANASRRALMTAGVPEDRIAQVVGKADTEPMDAANPEAATNRRVSIVLLREDVQERTSVAAAPAPKAWRSPLGTPAPAAQAAVMPAPAAVDTPPVPAPSEAPVQAIAPATPPAEAAAPASEPDANAEAAPPPPVEAEGEVAPPAPAEDGIGGPDPDLRDNWLRL